MDIRISFYNGIKSYIDLHASDIVSIEELAKNFNITVKSLQENFMFYFGVSDKVRKFL